MSARFQKILIVDDDPMLAKTLADILRFKRFDVCVASSAEDALHMLMKGGDAKPQTPFSPDCIISDIKMPGMNGVTLAQKITESFPDLPVVLMTAYTEEHILQEGLKKGVLAVLTKPLDIPYLLYLLGE